MKFRLAVASLLAFAALPAQAAYIGIHDDQSTVSISDGQFENGFSVNGNQISSGYGAGSYSVSKGTQLDFTGTWQTNNQAAGSFDIYVLAYVGDTDAIAHLFGTVTQINSTYSTISGTYLSGGTYAVNGGTTIASGGAADFSFAFSSNTLVVDQVPEPAMLGLFGMGAIALGAARRRKA